MTPTETNWKWIENEHVPIWITLMEVSLGLEEPWNYNTNGFVFQVISEETLCSKEFAVNLRDIFIWK